jgi:hypothetical protein
MQNSPSAHSKWLPNRQRDATKIRLSNLRRSESTDRAKPRDISRRAPARCKSRRGNYQTDCQICLSRPPLRIDPYQGGVSSKTRYCVSVSHTGDSYVVSFFMLCLTMMIFAGDANAVVCVRDARDRAELSLFATRCVARGWAARASAGERIKPSVR